MKALCAGAFAAILVLVPASRAALQITLQTDKPTYQHHDQVVVTVTIRNTGSGAVLLPRLDDADATHLAISVQHESGAMAVVAGRENRSHHVTTGFESLRAGQAMQVVRVLNKEDSGFWAQTEGLKGRFTVQAMLSVAPDQIPRNLVGRAFTGVVRSEVERDGRPNFLLLPPGCADIAALQKQAARRTKAGEPAKVNIRDLASLARQLPAGTECR